MRTKSKLQFIQLVRAHRVMTPVPGESPAGTCAVIKEIAAVGGDRVTIGAEGVRVNGLLLKNSAPRPADDAGRPLQPYYLSDYSWGPTSSC